MPSPRFPLLKELLLNPVVVKHPIKQPALFAALHLVQWVILESPTPFIICWVILKVSKNKRRDNVLSSLVGVYEKQVLEFVLGKVNLISNKIL
jgi:hypothetical protein